MDGHTMLEVGTGSLHGALIGAVYAFALCIAGARSSPGSLAQMRLLSSARMAAYGTCGLVLLVTLTLAVALLSADFRFRGEPDGRGSASTSDLLAAMWRGRHGSFLSWLSLLAAYTSACLCWMRLRHRTLQVHVIAVLMLLVACFATLILTLANPFEAVAEGTTTRWMMTTQSSYWALRSLTLYMGLVGCSIPFALCIAALISGEIETDWTRGIRQWMGVAWVWLSVEILLGMGLSHQEFGPTNYWIWHTGENAVLLPWLSGSAYLLSTLGGERRERLRTWTAVLACTTFVSSLFGTYLLGPWRVLLVGLHMAPNDMDPYFLLWMLLVTVASGGLILWRRLLRCSAGLPSLLNRETMYAAGSCVLLGFSIFIAVASGGVRVAEWTGAHWPMQGSVFFQRWATPLGLLLLALMGIAPLLAWQKTDGAALRRALVFPVAVSGLLAVVHVGAGTRFGFPAIITVNEAHQGLGASWTEAVSSAAPLLVITLVGFNFAVTLEALYRSVPAWRVSDRECSTHAFLKLLRTHRAYCAGHFVRTSICLIFIGFVGTGWGCGSAAVFVGGLTLIGSVSLWLWPAQSEKTAA